jgi:hypothetical protein
VSLWLARLTWVLLPLSAGGALGDSLGGWSTAPARLAAVLSWTAWAIGLIALLAPRPWGLTALRVIAPAATAVAIITISGTSAGAAVLAVSSSLVACGFALSAPVARAAASSGAYGDELRFPLRVPTSLLFGPVPLSVGLVGFGVSTGPLLIADGRFVVGGVATVLGLAVALAMLRALHGLACRWLVLVPAGVVIVDPLTLADPALMRREHITTFARAPIGRAGPDVIDLRLGTRGGTIEVALREPQSFARRRGRRDSELRDASVVLVSTVCAATVVDLAGRNRIGSAAT